MPRRSRFSLRQPWPLCKDSTLHDYSKAARGRQWWEMPGPGRGADGLISDVADRINRRRAARNKADLPIHGKVEWTEALVADIRKLWDSTKHMRSTDKRKWTGRRLVDRYPVCSVTTMRAVASGRRLPRIQ